MTLYNYSGLVAPRLSFYKVWFHLIHFVFAFWTWRVSTALPHTVRLVGNLH